MPDRTLLVPGTQATTLVDQNGTTVYNAVRVSIGLQKDDLGGRPPSEWQALLSQEHTPGELAPTRTSLLPGVEIHPGPVVRTPYDVMFTFSDPWPYDWRSDIRYNGSSSSSTCGTTSQPTAASTSSATPREGWSSWRRAP